MEHYNWGLPVAIDLFCAGLGAGAFMLAVMAQLAGDRRYRSVSLAGALLAPWPVILGVLLLVVDLGRPFRFWEMLLRRGPGLIMLSPTSTMSIGSWLLTIFVILSLVYLLVSLVTIPFPWGAPVRSFFGIIGLPIALAVTIYTGVLLAASPNPVWNVWVLPVVFVCSAIATGVACVIFWLALIQLLNRNAKFPVPKLTRMNSGIILFQLVFVIVLLVMGGLLKPISSAGLAGLWWVGAIVLGLVVPVLSGLKGERKPFAALVIATLVMLGGLFLRYVILIAGQTVV
ncbi:MAG: polysulfide reductase NrfD [Kiritimatiellae bacterium]|nr:polysulfide reductase NrfD [Kiritimatiellia bacterium]